MAYIDAMGGTVENVSQETFSAHKCTHKQDRPKGRRRCLGCHAAYMRWWRSSHPMTAEQRIKDNARSYANTYKRRGKLVPRPCDICGEADNVEMHHPDYSEPLRVVWLCRPHHLRLHAGTLATKGAVAC